MRDETPSSNAKEREVFGRPIIMVRRIAFKLANTTTEIDAASSLIWGGLPGHPQRRVQERRGLDYKYKASEVSGVGHRGGEFQEPRRRRRHPRDPVEALAPRTQDPTTTFEGTSEIQQLVIARAISGLRIE